MLTLPSRAQQRSNASSPSTGLRATPHRAMFEITLNLSTAYGDLLVTAEVERGHYSIGPVTRPDGSPVDVTLDLLEEIETSIDVRRAVQPLRRALLRGRHARVARLPRLTLPPPRGAALGPRAPPGTTMRDSLNLSAYGAGYCVNGEPTGDETPLRRLAAGLPAREAVPPLRDRHDHLRRRLHRVRAKPGGPPGRGRPGPHNPALPGPPRRVTSAARLGSSRPGGFT